MRHKGIALWSAAALAAAASGSAFAAQPSYDYVQFAYGTSSTSEFSNNFGSEDLDVDIYNLMVSGSFGGNWHAMLAYNDAELDDTFFGNSFKVESDGFNIVVGAHLPVTEDSLVYFDVQYFDYDGDETSSFSSGSTDFDNTGYGFATGIRWMITDSIEVEGGIAWVDGEEDYKNSSNDEYDYTTFARKLGGRYHWTPNFSTGINYIDGGSSGGVYGSDTSDAVSFDIRWTFGGPLSDSFGGSSDSY